MRGRLAQALVAALMVFPGCLSSGGSDDDATATSTAAPADDGSNLDEREFVLPPPAPEVPKPPSLDAAPEYRLGEWWRVRVQDNFTGETHETTRIVAGVEGMNYLIGMPRDEFANDMMVLHIPGFGQVSRLDLSFEIHDALFEPLMFPLIDGATWETAFEGRAITAMVTRESDTIATVELTGASDHIVATYDAKVGDVVRLAADGYATVEILDHGFGFEGVVTVPHQHDLIFQAFRLGPVLAGNLQPAGPTDVVEVHSTYDRVSFSIIIGDFLPLLMPSAPSAPTTTGVYRERVTAPDGTTYELTVTPADGPGLKIKSFMHVQPGGTWTFEHVAGGPGVVGTEGIAYHVYDVELPSGRILPSTGEHPHGG